MVDPNHVLPRTYEWNASAEQGLGTHDVISLSYVGAGARKLMRQDLYRAPNPNFTGEFDVMRNGASANYLSLIHIYLPRRGALARLAYSVFKAFTEGGFAR